MKAIFITLCLMSGSTVCMDDAQKLEAWQVYNTLIILKYDDPEIQKIVEKIGKPHKNQLLKTGLIRQPENFDWSLFIHPNPYDSKDPLTTYEVRTSGQGEPTALFIKHKAVSFELLKEIGIDESTLTKRY